MKAKGWREYVAMFASGVVLAGYIALLFILFSIINDLANKLPFCGQ